MLWIPCVIFLTFVFFFAYKLLKPDSAEVTAFNEAWRVGAAGGALGDAAAAPTMASREESDSEEEAKEGLVPRGRLAKMKAAKDKKKEEKRKRHEATQQNNTQQRADADRKRRAREEREHLEDAREQERLLVLEEKKQKRSLEEQNQWEGGMGIEEEGEYEEEDSVLGPMADEDVAADFIAKVKTDKVTLLEPLAAHFNTTVERCVTAIETFQANGTLPGVFDERGKFIHITESEYEAVAAFIEKRGRLSINDLASHSAGLVDLSCKE